MPLLTLPCDADGAVVEVRISISSASLTTLNLPHQLVPPPRHIRMLIDPGAAFTCVESSALQPLGLSASNSVPMLTPSTGPNPIYCNEFVVDLAILHPVQELLITSALVVECMPLGSSYLGLLGRDILAHCLFIYDGPSQSFTLAF